MKRCSACGVEKECSAFAKCSSTRDGLQYRCRSCDAEWAKANRASKKLSRKAFYERNKESEIAKVSRWRRENRAKVRAANRKYHSKNVAQITARKRAARRRATPPWANAKAIKAIYAEAKRMSLETGVRHEVDHIIPLKSQVVCGLHWEGNLQVLPAEINRIKGNTLWP